jgi:FMN phosphatase YigB (HAD superfamily)
MKAVIFDVDGTLADVSAIRHFVLKDDGRKDFHKFHAASIDCPPHDHVVRMLREFKREGYTILVVTARKNMWFYHTLIWMDENAIPHDYLFMRADDDQRPDFEVKKDILNEIRRRGFVVEHAVDDNPSVIRLWEEEGIPHTIVPGWA